MTDMNLQTLREEIQEAFETLGRELSKQGTPSEGVMRALGCLQDALGPLLVDDADQSIENERYEEEKKARSQFIKEGAKAGVKLQRKQIGRNDHGRDPAGYSLVAGRLAKLVDLGAPEAQTVEIAHALLESVGRWFQTPDSKGIPIRALLATSRPLQSLRNHAAAIDATWAAYVTALGGERWPWERALEGQLEMDAVHREEERLLAARSIPAPQIADVELLGPLAVQADQVPDGSFFAPATGEEMHAYLVCTGIDLPKELTPAVIEEMRQRVGLNKGGPAKKRTARAVVEDFAKSLESLEK